MPALRWEECKQIANYQKIESPFTYDHIILFLALLAFPTHSTIDDYREVTSTALRNTNILIDDEKLELWRNSLEIVPEWEYNDVCKEKIKNGRGKLER